MKKIKFILEIRQNIMRKIRSNNKKSLMKKYLYDNKLKKVKTNFDDAYQNIDKLWHDQFQINNIRYSFISGNILSSYFNVKKKLSVLDIGCGYGSFPNFLNKFSNFNVYGIDISKYAIDVGKKKYNFKNINYGNINDPNFRTKKKFDIITIIGVFWFMFESFKICHKNLEKILKKNGSIYFQINIPKDNNIFKNRIKSYDELFYFLSKFFKINDFLIFEKKTHKNKNLRTIQDTCLIKCKLR